MLLFTYIDPDFPPCPPPAPAGCRRSGHDESSSLGCWEGKAGVPGEEGAGLWLEGRAHKVRLCQVQKATECQSGFEPVSAGERACAFPQQPQKFWEEDKTVAASWPSALGRVNWLLARAGSLLFCQLPRNSVSLPGFRRRQHCCGMTERVGSVGHRTFSANGAQYCLMLRLFYLPPGTTGGRGRASWVQAGGGQAN